MAENVCDVDVPVFKATRLWLDTYFAGVSPNFLPELSLSGSAFQIEVWEVLKDIHFGSTMTYGQVADIICRKRGLQRMSAQAIGNAVSHNPVAIIIPCHRVVGANGKLTGYAAGTDKKLWLLQNEKVSL